MGNSATINSKNEDDKWAQAIEAATKPRNKSISRGNKTESKSKTNNEVWNKVKNYKVTQSIHNLEARARRSPWKEKLSSASKDAETIRKKTAQNKVKQIITVNVRVKIGDLLDGSCKIHT